MKKIIHKFYADTGFEIASGKLPHRPASEVEQKAALYLTANGADALNIRVITGDWKYAKIVGSDEFATPDDGTVLRYTEDSAYGSRDRIALVADIWAEAGDYDVQQAEIAVEQSNRKAEAEAKAEREAKELEQRRTDLDAYLADIDMSRNNFAEILRGYLLMPEDSEPSLDDIEIVRGWPETRNNEGLRIVYHSEQFRWRQLHQSDATDIMGGGYSKVD